MKPKLRRALASAAALAGIATALVTGTAHATGDLPVKIQSWNGLCLTVTDASLGSDPVQTGCTHAHNFELDTDHNNIFVQGHPGACLADSFEGLMFIDACSNGDSVVTPDATKVMGNTNYGRLHWHLWGDYAHANGNAQFVTMIQNPGSSLAVYWALIVQTS